MLKRPSPRENAGKTHCIRGHALAGDNLKITAKGGRVCRACAKAAKRADQRHIRKIKKQRHGYSLPSVRTIPEQVLQQAFAEVRSAQKLKAGERIVGPKWRAFLAFHPKIRAALKKHVKVWGRPKSPRDFALKGDGLLEAVYAVIPVHLPKDMRDDIASAMFIAVGEERLRLRDLAARVDEFVRASFASDHNRYGPVSIDVPLGHDTTQTLAETLPAEAGNWMR